MKEHDLPLVLIVDDDARNRRLAVDVLRPAGFATIEAETGAEAMALAASRLPDVVLMDLRLPDQGGELVARTLRSDPLTSHVPIVAMTALPLDAEDGWLTEAGFAGSIGKPIDVDAFPGVVRRFCSRNG